MSFLKDNPERVMFFLFPIALLGLFVATAVLWWLIQTYMQNGFAL